jgi:hypothetical protein
MAVAVATGAEAQPPRVAACALRILQFYGHREDAPRRCVATVMTVDIINISPSARFVGIPPHVLPFGLLESIIVRRGCSDEDDGGSSSFVPAADGGSADAGTVSLEFRRLVTSGSAKGPTVPYGDRTTLTVGELNVDDDAQHEDLLTVRQLSGHDFRFRAVAAASLLALKVHFESGPVPSAIRLEYWGANVLPADCTPATAAALLDANVRVMFALAPLPPKQRFAAAAAKASALQAAADAGSTK